MLGPEWHGVELLSGLCNFSTLALLAANLHSRHVLAYTPFQTKHADAIHLVAHIPGLKGLVMVVFYMSSGLTGI
jgi:hypothetical protein